MDLAQVLPAAAGALALGVVFAILGPLAASATRATLERRRERLRLGRRDPDHAGAGLSWWPWALFGLALTVAAFALLVLLPR